jgi:hypothetical protein
LLDAGRIADALGGYRGPILPASDAPAIVEARETLDYSLRQAVLGSGDPDLLEAWLQLPSGHDDLEVCRTLTALLPTPDPRRPAALSRLRRLSGRR